MKKINPSDVPYKTLYTGSKMPVVGLGTFGSDRFSAKEIAMAVKDAISIGYRHIDCASVYGNEKEIGESLYESINGGVDRKDLWITSKVWNDMHGKGDVLKSCKKSLEDLQLDYLDLYLVHWPFPNYHASGCDVNSRNENAKPYIHEKFMETWNQMEELVSMGLVKNIGTSNMTSSKLELLLRDAKIKPSVNEMELHPHFQQPELHDYCLSNNIQPIGFCPIGSPTRPDRDKVDSDTVDIEDPVIKSIAKNHNIHPATACVKWAVQNGQVPIPFSIHENEYYSNLLAAVEDPLSESEMDKIKSIDKNCRLIKGQVFLWRENQDWKDLWDEDGKIAE